MEAVRDDLASQQPSATLAMRFSQVVGSRCATAQGSRSVPAQTVGGLDRLMTPTLIAFPLEHAILGAGQGVSLIAAIALIGAILLASVRVAHHAEGLAERVGEPYGTMILTLSAVPVEVVILAIMMSHTSSPTLVRDTISPHAAS